MLLDRDALRRDTAERIRRVQAAMAAAGLDALVVAGNGSPDGLGALRYLGNARVWAGSGYLVLGRDDPKPHIVIVSAYQAAWTRAWTTTDPDRVECPGDALARVAELAQGSTRPAGRIGICNLTRMSVAEHTALMRALSGYEIVDATELVDRLRRIKSPFEIEALRAHGAALDAVMDVFADAARVGRPYSRACAAVETELKAAGAFWGRTKLSLDMTPYTVPPPPDRLVTAGDVCNFEIVYESPLGYWLEMTTVFAIGAMPDAAQRLFGGYVAAFDASAKLAKPGARLGDFSRENDAVLAARGFRVAGKHTPDAHSIGLDGADGPNALAAPDFVLEAGMVLSFHPGTVLDGSRGFLISDNLLVTDNGGQRLSPHGPERTARVLPA